MRMEVQRQVETLLQEIKHNVVLRRLLLAYHFLLSLLDVLLKGVDVEGLLLVHLCPLLGHLEVELVLQ